MKICERLFDTILQRSTDQKYRDIAERRLIKLFDLANYLANEEEKRLNRTLSVIKYIHDPYILN